MTGKLMLTERRLVAAGWIAMVSALLTIPWVIATFFIERGGTTARALQIVILIGGAVLFVFLMATLKRLLRGNYAFTRADTPIDLLVKANVVSAAVGSIGLSVPAMESSLAVFGLVMVVIIGILQIVFGVRLLSLPDNLMGLHKPFCWLNIVTGASLAVIVLLPVGMVTSAVSDVMLGTIFFQAAKDLARGRAAASTPGEGHS